MREQQALTTNQVAVLDIIRCLHEYEEEGFYTFEEKLNAFSWDSTGMKEAEVDEEIELLEYYHYLNEDKTLTNEGKQYLKLAKEYVKNSKNQNGSFISINDFTLLNVDVLGKLFNTTINLEKIFEVSKANAGKAVINIQNLIQGKH